MLLPILLTTAVLLPTSLAIEYSPFIAPDNPSLGLDLFRRDSECANSCSSMGGADSDVCCGKKTKCVFDQAGNVACCPYDSVCTGTINVAPARTTAPAAGSAASAPGPAITHAISGTSTISNQYYPFPVLQTPFADVADCTESYSSCQAESAKCTGLVAGGGYGVTVSGQNGAITQQAAMPASSAESICSSLSLEACHGLQLAQCSTLGGAAARATAGGSFVAGDSANAAAAPTRCRGVYGMAVVVMVGVAGHL